jgi:tRNA A-37 threonylcarbamoyl transferase component Bud32
MTTLLKLDIKKGNGVLFDSRNNLIKKFYFQNSKSNNKKLINEFCGYKWYLRRLYKKKLNKKKLDIQKKSNTLILPVFKGQHFNFWDNTIYSTGLVDKVINHYNLLWPREKYVPFHGDLTIENIIFQKQNDIVFIDWENYKSKEEWGLDICYFLISLIVLPVLSFKKESIRQSELNLFTSYWKKTFEKKKYGYLKDPIQFIKKKCIHKGHFFFKITKKIAMQINQSIL